MIIMIVMISYGGAAAVPDRSIVSALTGVYLDSLYYLGPAGSIFLPPCCSFFRLLKGNYSPGPVSKEKAPGS